MRWGEWRKSSYSGQYNCVEVALTSEIAAVRDSKDRAAGHFAVSARCWGSFVWRVKDGAFDRW